MTKIFVNYRRDDARDITARIRDRLALAFGEADVFMDVSNLVAGQRFDAELSNALRDADIFLVVIGARWESILSERERTQSRDFVREEIAEALGRKIDVIPVLIDATPLPQASNIPLDIRDLLLHQSLTVSYERFDTDVSQLQEAIRFARRKQSVQRNLVRRNSAISALKEFKRYSFVIFGAMALLISTYFVVNQRGVFAARGSASSPLAEQWTADYQSAVVEQERSEAAERQRIADARKRAESEAAERKKAEDARMRAETEAAERMKAEDVRKRAEAEAAERKKLEDARKRAEAEAAERKKAEDARKHAEAEAAERNNAEDARKRAEVEAAERKKAEDARKRAEAEAAERKNAEDARKRAEVEAAERKKAEDARKRAEAEAAERKKVEDVRMRAEAEAAERKKAEGARKRAEAEAAERKKAEDVRMRAEAEAAERKKAEDARKRAEAETAERKKAEDARKRAEAAAVQRSETAERIRVAEALAAAALKPNSPVPAQTLIDPGKLVPPGQASVFRDTLSDGRPCPHCPELVALPAGKFLMGSSKAEIAAVIASRGDFTNAYEAEGPQHTVSVSRPILAGASHVTRFEFERFVTATTRKMSNGCYVYRKDQWVDEPGRSWLSPGFEQGGNHPVVCISWTDADDYVRWLSNETGHRYRLMSEAEAEYAARAVNVAIQVGGYGFGNDQRALCDFGNSMDLFAADHFGISPDGASQCVDGYAFTAPIKSFKPNAWGLYDTQGNVWSWTSDCWNDRHENGAVDSRPRSSGDCGRRVVRGGSWGNGPADLRSAARDSNEPQTRSSNLGFRVVRELDPG